MWLIGLQNFFGMKDSATRCSKTDGTIFIIKYSNFFWREFILGFSRFDLFYN